MVEDSYYHRESVYFDPSVGPWQKMLGTPDGGFGAGEVYTLTEVLRVFEGLDPTNPAPPWTDYHESILTPGWTWIEDALNPNWTFVSDQPGLAASHLIDAVGTGVDWTFTPTANVGTTMTITKYVMYTGGGDPSASAGGRRVSDCSRTVVHRFAHCRDGRRAGIRLAPLPEQGSDTAMPTSHDPAHRCGCCASMDRRNFISTVGLSALAAPGVFATASAAAADPTANGAKPRVRAVFLRPGKRTSGVGRASPTTSIGGKPASPRPWPTPPRNLA